MRYIAVGIFLLSTVLFGMAQKPAPIVYRLNPEASHQWTRLIQTEADLQKQWNDVQEKKQLLLIAAGVPAEERDRKWTVDGQQIAFWPKPAPSPSIP